MAKILNSDNINKYAVGVENFDGDARVGLLVDSFVNAPHSPVGDDATELVASAESTTDAWVVLVSNRHEAGQDERATVCRTKARVIRERALALRAALHAGVDSFSAPGSFSGEGEGSLSAEGGAKK